MSTRRLQKLISWLITIGALFFLLIDVDWGRITVSDWPFLNAFFKFNKGGLQLLAGTLLIMLSGFCLLVQQLKPAIAFFALGAFFAAMSGTTPFHPCDNLNPNVSCEALVNQAIQPRPVPPPPTTVIFPKPGTFKFSV
jgi:hypothetical protein